MNGENRKAGMVVGWAVYGAITIGVLSILGAATSFFLDRQAFALCLVAGALAFGLLSNAALRQ
ncbi:MAG: hypothetical protein WEE89_12420 [Gemmatimonadota bacterium]